MAINEVSQGSSGTKEYAELVVVGNPTCTTVATVDMRGYIFDDNNGFFSGTGVATGCMRLSNDPLWSAVPAGTIILLYNDADQEPTIPAQDLSLTDGNCKLVIPVSNCTLIQVNASQPSTTNPVFPSTFTNCGDWTKIGLANTGGDTFQVRDALGNLISAVSYGNNNSNNMVYVASLTAQKVTSNLNSVDNNPYNSANWSVGSVPANETPGAPNNAANAAWISSMNFSCGTIIPTVLTATVSSTNAGCTCTGSATVAASGAVGPYTYSWSPSGGTGTTASGLCAGNYSVTVNSANGCVETVTVNISSVNLLTATVTATDVSCNGNVNGSATVTTTNAVLPLTYTWSPTGGNNSIASNISIGNYSVTLTDANSCTVTASTVINQPTTLSVSIAATNVSCNGGSTGAATLATSGGTSPYTYTWSPSGGNNAIANNLAQGTYSIHILDAHLCVKDTQVVITEPPAITATLTSSASTCGSANGSTTATAAGGTGTLNYTWTPTGGNASTANNLSAGLYTVTIADALSCLLSDTVRVQQFLPPVLSISTTSVLCNGGNSGTATSTITSGGTPAYTYNWMPSGGNNASATGLAQGNYTLFVTDAKGCKDTAYATIVQPTSITATLTSTPATCGNNNGTITSSVSGGVGAYTYTWMPSGGNSSVANSLASGSYSVTIQDGNSCTYSASINVGNKPSPVLSITSTSVACFGSSTGSASVTINAGTGTSPFTYSWSPVTGSNPNITNLPVGSYTVLVTDSAHCTATETVTINQPIAPLTATATSTAASCNQTNGTASVLINGGTSSYLTVWSPSGGNNTTATNLAGGITYTCTITDANMCTFNVQTTVTQNSTISLTVTSTPATCGLINGTASVTATGGLPAQAGYTYTWVPFGGNNNLATGLTGNTNYTVSVSDSAGCLISKNITVSNKPSPVLSIASASVACFGASTGNASVSINATTGTAPFTYSWSPVNGSNPSINNLPAGNYTVLITDSANCTATATVNIIQPTALTVTATSTLATCGLANGIATCTVSGGTPNYTYIWSPGGGNNQTTTNNLAGNITYTVTVKDSNNCIDTASVYIHKTPALTLTIASTNSVSCNGANDGSITATSSGSSNTTYNWIPAVGSNTLTVHNLPGSVSGTTYTLVGNDGGCKDSITATILEPQTFSITVNNPTVCVGQTTTLTASGANTYTWSSGATAASTTVNPVSTTVYTVNATNSNGCPAIQNTATVTVSPALTISVTPSNTTICQGKSTTLNATSSGGGGGTNQYTWSPVNASSSSITVSPTVSTIYTVSVYNAVCSATASITAQVNVYANPVMSFSATPTSGCAPVCVNFTASQGLTSYNWNFGDGNNGASSNVTHCYPISGNYDVSVSAITSNSCVIIVTQANFVNVFANPQADFTASSFTTTVTEGTINFTDESSTTITNWNWTIDTITSITKNPTYVFATEGTYSVTLIVTNTNGCMDTITKEMVIEPDFVLYAPNCFTPNGNGRNDVFLPVGTGWNSNYFDLWIYDRWGNTILHTTNPTQGWDGKKQNEIVQQDTYVWKVSLYDINGMPHEFHGQVTVIK